MNTIDLDKITDANILFYDSDASRRELKDYPSWKHRLREEVVAISKDFKNPRLLDIGCGVGVDLAFFSKKGILSKGIDISSASVAIAKSKGLLAEIMDMHYLSIPENSFELVYSMNGLVHVPKYCIDDVFSELSKLLTQNGFFCVGVYGGREFQKFVTMQSDLRGESSSENQCISRFFASYSFDSYKSLLLKRFSIIHSERIEFPKQEFHWFMCRKKELFE